jgi:hypothetical protein
MRDYRIYLRHGFAESNRASGTGAKGLKMITQQPHISVRCAYIIAGPAPFCAVPLTFLSEEELIEKELMACAERRVADKIFELKNNGYAVKPEIQIGFVMMKNDAYKCQEADSDYND